MLSEEHRKQLEEGSGISEEIIQARGYKTVTSADELRPLGFTRVQWSVPGLLVPLHFTDGGNGLHVYRPDRPRMDKKGTKVIKYEFPRGQNMRLDVHPLYQPLLADPSIPLWLTEGSKKGDALASYGLCAIALQGVWNWRGTNSVDGLTVLADWEHVALNGRLVNVVFDSDVTRKAEIKKCLERLTRWLQSKKARVNVIYLPQNGSEKVGVDDYLLTHSLEDLENLVEAPRPSPKAAPTEIELLEDAPKSIRRPLSLIDGTSYAAIWPWVQITQTESLNKEGEVVRHDPPRVSKEQWLMLVRGDGARFSQEGAEGIPSFAELGIDVRLPEVPRQDRLWSTPGVKRYLAGNRPDPMDVFNRVSGVADRFMSFDYSLSDQKTMSDLVACYILSTYFTPAFQVIGYIWPNGDFGCGKSKLLLVVSELAYLGMFILAAGSYACLRDLSDYGATLAFDDAEEIMDRKAVDSDKRNLLLAGNRRGATAPLKELVNGKEWRTRHVDAFAPKLFSATKLPNGALDTRTIVIPLLRTLDRDKANADPLDYTLWPHDRQALVDDLWALALAHLPELPDVDQQIAERASLKGRDLEPWRAILAIALWLDEGLFTRMDALSVAYQDEKKDLGTTDLSALCAEAMMELAEKPEAWEDESLKFSVSELSKVITRLAKEMDRHDGDEPYASPQKIGVRLTKMRIGAARKDDKSRARYRFADYNMLQRLAQTYRLTCPTCPSMSNTSTSGEDGAGQVDKSGHVGHVQQRVDDEQKQHSEGGQQGHGGHAQQGGTPEKSVIYDGVAGQEKARKGSIPLADVGKAQLDKTKLQEGLDAGLSQAEAREAARVGPLCLCPSHTKYWLRPDGSPVCAECHPPADGVIILERGK